MGGRNNSLGLGPDQVIINYSNKGGSDYLQGFCSERRA